MYVLPSLLVYREIHRKIDLCTFYVHRQRKRYDVFPFDNDKYLIKDLLSLSRYTPFHYNVTNQISFYHHYTVNHTCLCCLLYYSKRKFYCIFVSYVPSRFRSKKQKEKTRIDIVYTPRCPVNFFLETHKSQRDL